MKINSKNLIGYFLMVLGLLVVFFSNKIVFPCLERLIGIEAIVGKENVFYQPDGLSSGTSMVMPTVKLWAISLPKSPWKDFIICPVMLFIWAYPEVPLP